MRRLYKRGREKIGAPPGSVIHTGDKKTDKPRLEITEYNEVELTEKQLDFDLASIYNQEDDKHISWLDIKGVHNEDFIRKIGLNFNIHSLVLEDIVNTEQRPKIDVYENYIFFVLPILKFDDDNSEVTKRQVSIILGNNYVITFQDLDGEFSAIKKRINLNANIRKQGADYLAYALIDTVVDEYYLLLESLGNKIESLEKKLIDNPSSELLEKIKFYRNEISMVRKMVRPIREIIRTLLRVESNLITDNVTLYLKDVYDHILEIIDLSSLLHDMLTNSLDFYLSSLSNRMNEVMKVLTIIATLFIPITFITGLYGMNFKYMPGLEDPVGYFLVIIIMVITVLLFLVYFKKKKWF